MELSLTFLFAWSKRQRNAHNYRTRFNRYVRHLVGDRVSSLQRSGCIFRVHNRTNIPNVIGKHSLASKIASPFFLFFYSWNFPGDVPKHSRALQGDRPISIVIVEDTARKEMI